MNTCIAALEKAPNTFPEKQSMKQFNNGEHKKKFTVIIPTRNRADTLYYSLKTCVTQRFKDMVIIVSDNNSCDSTRQVAQSFGDKRVVYINTGKSVSMASNWEFALDHAEKGYVTFLGDDDGLLPDAINDIARLLEKHNAQAIAWSKVGYSWPSEVHSSNSMIIPIRKNLVLSDSKTILSSMTRWRTNYARGPCLYNSFVDRDTINDIKKEGMPFFNSVTPDVYSSFAILSKVDDFIFSERPFSVAGASQHGNWVKFYNFDVNSKNDVGDNFLNEIDLPVHPMMDILPGSMSAVVTEAMLQAREHVFGCKLNINYLKAIWMILKEYSGRNSERYLVGMGKVEKLMKRNGRYWLFLIMKYMTPNRPVSSDLYTVDKTHLGYLHLFEVDHRFGVENVAEACDLVAKIIGPFTMPTSIKRFKWYHPYTGFVHRRLAAIMDVR